MKITIAPENFMEWVAKKANLAPMPLVETQITFTAARSIMAGAELGVYEALGKDKKTAEEVAQYCRTHAMATKQLLDCLVGVGYLNWSDNKYSLKPKYYKWLLKESESNLIGKLKFQIYEWDYMSKLEEYVRTGKSLELHSMTNKAEWESYQEGMRDLSVNVAKELAKKIPIDAKATTMLDIGGSHGLFSIELCRKYPSLHSVILELPGAIDAASGIAKRYDDTKRVTYRPGNALEDDLGSGLYDLVMINNVVHHFTAEQNRSLAKKIAKSLKPNGIYVIGEIMRSEKPGEGGVVGATTGLYFSLTSYSGTWSQSEIESWMSDAGLHVQKAIAPMSFPGFKQMVSRK
jgi:2-polyprenyl-3-methyl-5-hydroxy-6-metoxy-1,4-benzoquinol methylase